MRIFDFALSLQDRLPVAERQARKNSFLGFNVVSYAAVLKDVPTKAGSDKTGAAASIKQLAEVLG
ncbi:MAG: hypothetical protein U0892_10720 [Pirellulales bacterium]